MTAKASSRQLLTPRRTSPFNLMQERYRSDPWALLVGCILFNMVRGKKAQPIHEKFLNRWPGPLNLWWVNPEEKSGVIVEMVDMFKTLGFQNRRAQRVWKMTEDFLLLRPDVHADVDIEELHGIGKYGADSFNIFCRGILIEDARDKELRRYVEWAFGQGAGRVLQKDP